MTLAIHDLFRWMLVIAFVVLPTAAFEVGAADETTLQRAQKQGYIRVGFANEAPFGHATQDGKLTGEAPEIARKILSRMGIKEVDGVLTEFGSLIPGLNARRFDIIAAGMFITPKRCMEIAFSEPTYGLGQAFLIKKGNPKELHSYEDAANNTNATLGVMAGTAERDYARKTGIPDNRVLTFPDTPSLLAAVQAGRVDAHASNSLTIQTLIDTAGPDAGVERAAPFVDPIIDGKSLRGHGGFAFRKEDEDLITEFNKQLKDFIGTPEHLELVKAFGFTKAELPDKTTVELCAGS